MSMKKRINRKQYKNIGKVKAFIGRHIVGIVFGRDYSNEIKRILEEDSL